MRIKPLLLLLIMLAPSAALTQSAFRIDPARTTISFVIDAVGFPQTRGVFRQFSGRLVLDFNRPSRSRVSFNVVAASLDTGSRGLDDYIRAPGFLDVMRHPTISFASTNVEKRDEQTAVVTGDLTMLGVTRPVVFTVGVARDAGRSRAVVDFVAKGVVQRSQFGMINGQPLVSDDVTITVSTEASQE
ncbi:MULTISPECIES: YceI family protein [unclassified Chelatococcus]|uniref:YceI family protein n=1 Tax=unclassified Chelatococcus TaxID=2638111 RepID=UPI001BCBFAD1|nr:MULTISPECIES: YceI family protein [unclassified Chelatococcus]MBS7697553.1 YceI family protein [Chelatococcus sp. YT9]MBX3559372.1 YceI family protein [Chelatococcus sp.]